MPSHERENLAHQQARLVGALHGGAAPPGEFDPRRLQIAADSLRRKRRRSVEKVWPALRNALCEQFAAEFEAYSTDRSPPQDPATDAREFGRWLARRPAISDQVRIELAAARLWPVLPAILLLRETGKVAILIRLGGRVFQFRLPPRRPALKSL